MTTMSDSTVTLLRCEDYRADKVSACLKRHIELLGGLDKFIKKGDRVLLKPNFIAPRPAQYATQTHPAVIIEMAKILKDFGARPFVGDSPAWSSTRACAYVLGLVEPLKKLNVPIKSLNRPVKCRIGKNGTTIGLSSIALDADAIINLPKFKSHQQLVATFAVKNMFGVVCGKRKALLHFEKGKSIDNFCQMLIDIYKFTKPAFTILDAVEVMDSQGPIRGRTRPLGWLIAGVDPMAIERVCCKLINIDPEIVPIIRQAQKMRFGCCDSDEIRVLGNDYSAHICTDFVLPQLIPIRFSLPRVCKSIAKQIILLTRSAFSRKKE
jgi:uncharacterized protein (DUF362 family)